jgi:hypothetical protein
MTSGFWWTLLAATAYVVASGLAMIVVTLAIMLPIFALLGAVAGRCKAWMGNGRDT